MGAFLFIGFLFSIPIYIRAILALVCPLAVDATGAKFSGHYRHWEARSLTGRVSGTNTYATTTSQVTYETNQYHGGTDRRVSSSTTVHQTLLLTDAAGQQHSYTLTNFGLEVFSGQFVSMCWGVKGRKNTVVAVLNHSTQRQFTQRRQLDKILIPRVALFTICAIASIVCSVIGSIVFGLLLALIPVFFFALANRRQRRRFEISGIRPLWAATAVSAAAP